MCNIQTKELLSNFTGIKVPILGDLPVINILFQKYKVNATVNNLLLAGNKFMSEMHLKQLGFAYSACGPLTKNKERIKKLKKQEIQDILIKMNCLKLVDIMIWIKEILKI